MSGIARQAVSPIKTVRNLETFGWLELGRGKVISKEDIENSPGEYPVYSSAFTDDGFFGKYGEYLFSDERVSWSIDGGGMPFYRHKHRYSLTNVSGWMRVVNKSALNTRYLYYAVFNEWYRNSFDYALKAHPSVIRDLYAIPLPTLEIQQRIADYLDRETAEIDAAVADLDKYVKLLRLRVRKLINEQLMSGYPEVKMGLLAESIIGLTYRPENVVDEGGIYVYRSGNVQESKIDRSNMLAVDVEVPPHLRFKRGDILMCSRNGSANLVGKNAIVDPCDYGQTWGAFMTVIRSDLNRYLYWFFRSPRFDDYRGSFSSSTINQLTTGILNRIPVPLPPENKRDEITAFLEEEVSKIDSLIEESTKLRNLLLKRRSVLITEVVTGRKQV